MIATNYNLVATLSDTARAGIVFSYMNYCWLQQRSFIINITSFERDSESGWRYST